LAPSGIAAKLKNGFWTVSLEIEVNIIADFLRLHKDLWIFYSTCLREWGAGRTHDLPVNDSFDTAVIDSLSL